MQDIFHDFVLWLLKFLAVSTGLLTAARIWTLRRKRKAQRKPTSIGKHTAGAPSKETQSTAVLGRVD